MNHLDELEAFEPLTRARSNTWPLPHPEYDLESTSSSVVPGGTPVHPSPSALSRDNVASQHHAEAVGSVIQSKKNSSRRNAWGNMSYADLITQAIQSSPENRLTLSQIYDWMVQNVPYFKDKGDSNSSAGWKNSIRHNLSLHNRFMRVQNEGAGKSSWWMINPDARPGKAARRRAASMETQKYEKKRGRIKKKVEQIRASAASTSSYQVVQDSCFGKQMDGSSPGSSEGLDLFPDSPIMTSNFQMSPDFRPRTSSNASSLSRLSPITCDAALGDSPLSPTVGWQNSEAQGVYNSLYTSSICGNDLESLKLCDTMNENMNLNDIGVVPNLKPPQSSYAAYSSFDEQVGPTSTSSAVRIVTVDPLVPFSTPDDKASVELLCTNVQESSLGTDIGLRDDLLDISESTLFRGTCTKEPLDSRRADSSQDKDSRVGANHDDFNLDQLPDTVEGGLECDVDQVISHELSMDGSLDFTFDATTGMVHDDFEPDRKQTIPVDGSQQRATLFTASPSWVR